MRKNWKKKKDVIIGPMKFFFSFLCEKRKKKEKLFHFTSAGSSLFVLAIHEEKQHSKFPELVHLTAHVMTRRQRPFFFPTFFLHDHIHKMIVSLQRVRLGCELGGGGATRCYGERMIGRRGIRLRRELWFLLLDHVEGLQ